MKGIYLITNKINNKNYVGQSVDIKQRWGAHRNAAYNPNNSEYMTPLHIAMRKYGLENFEFSILEEVEDPNKRDEREKFWIKEKEAYSKGYNQVEAGGKILLGEAHQNSIFTNEEVRDIRIRWFNKERPASILESYKNKISTTKQLSHILDWSRYGHILPELNTPEIREWHRQQGRKEGVQKRLEKIQYAFPTEDLLKSIVLYRLGWAPNEIRATFFPEITIHPYHFKMLVTGNRKRADITEEKVQEAIAGGFYDEDAKKERKRIYRGKNKPKQK